MKGDSGNVGEMEDTPIETYQSLQHENLKKENMQQVVQVWEKRLEFTELKCKFPALGTEEDEELLFKKEWVIKKLRVELTKYDGVFRIPSMLIDLSLPAITSPT